MADNLPNYVVVLSETSGHQFAGVVDVRENRLYACNSKICYEVTAIIYRSKKSADSSEDNLDTNSFSAVVE